MAQSATIKGKVAVSKAMKLKCPMCGFDGAMGPNSNFEVLGRYNGYPAYMCKSCGKGLRITNAGRAMITKRAKAALLPAGVVDDMNKRFEEMMKRNSP